MEKHYIYGLIFLCALSLAGCREKEDRLEPWNAGPLEEYTVTPIAGGAVISYTIPKDPDILYIMAEYERIGQVFTEKSSIYDNVLTIEGFDTLDPVRVTLYKVNRHEQRSLPLTVEFTPLLSPIRVTLGSVVFRPAFGGILVSWENGDGTELGIHLYKEEDGEMVSQDIYYTAKPSDSHAFRGFEVEETTFGVCIEDKWGNISEMKTVTLTPNFETLIEKPYFDYRAYIPYDNTSNYGTNYVLSKAWDNIVATRQNGWLTRSGNSGCSFTIDIGRLVKLSRIVQHFYQGATYAPYGQANINEFEVWGIDEIDPELQADADYWLDEWSLRRGNITTLPVEYAMPERTFKDDWAYLGLCTVPYYENQGEVDVMCTEGQSFDMPEEAPAVRYVRFFVRQVTLQPTPVSNYFSLGEITFYGDDNVATP